MRMFNLRLFRNVPSERIFLCDKRLTNRRVYVIILPLNIKSCDEEKYRKRAFAESAAELRAAHRRLREEHFGASIQKGLFPGRCDGGVPLSAKAFRSNA